MSESVVQERRGPNYLQVVPCGVQSAEKSVMPTEVVALFCMTLPDATAANEMIFIDLIVKKVSLSSVWGSYDDKRRLCI